ncbi:MAG TPA: HD domain-containing phosphohydrolase [Gaiellaceae bacterium]|nr:HD domain-containing phosphohydrolase [Gaiellaceae bacterium]
MSAASAASAHVLVVDDEPVARRLAVRVLERHGYACAEAADAAEALAAVEAAPPDVMVSDVNMPGESGLELVRRVSAGHPHVATVMVTMRDDPEVADEALEGGAYGYVIKPFEPNELVIAVAGALRRRALAEENRMHRERLAELVERRTRELESSRAEAVERLARAVDSRDPETGSHLERMSVLVARLARALGWSDEHAETLRLASLLHDVGKVGVADDLLLKQAPLEPAERSRIEAHAAIGHAILAGGESELMQLADLIAWTHHERFDGSGYPRGLAGEEIPIAGRIAAVADVFDALTSDRPYRPALSTVEALRSIRADRGRGFDPAVVDALLALEA